MHSRYSNIRDIVNIFIVSITNLAVENLLYSILIFNVL